MLLTGIEGKLNQYAVGERFIAIESRRPEPSTPAGGRRPPSPLERSATAAVPDRGALVA